MVFLGQIRNRSRRFRFRLVIDDLETLVTLFTFFIFSSLCCLPPVGRVGSNRIFDLLKSYFKRLDVEFVGQTLIASHPGLQVFNASDLQCYITLIVLDVLQL